MPQLISVVDSLDKVPEPARQFYVQKDGKYHVDLSGAPAGYVPASDLAAANGKVVEFRDTNIALSREVGELRPLKVQFEGIDPKAAKDAIAKVAELAAGGVRQPGDITTQIQAAVQAAIKPLNEKITASEQTAAAERTRADESVLRSNVSEQFLKVGGKAKAVDFIVGKAKEVFEIAGGLLKAKENKFSAMNPGNPLGVEEWLATQVKEHDFAFEVSTGSGAAPKGGPTPPRPGQTILKDPTPAQLGQYASDIRGGKVKVEYTTQ